jgi:hypothetical protein
MTNEASIANDVIENSHNPKPLTRRWRSTTVDIFAAFKAAPLFFQLNIRIYCAIEIESNSPVRTVFDESGVGTIALSVWDYPQYFAILRNLNHRQSGVGKAQEIILIDMKSRPSPTQTRSNNTPRLSRAGKKIKAEIEERFGFFPALLHSRARNSGDT